MNRYLGYDGALFLHVPRTGGTWVQTALCRLGIRSRSCSNRCKNKYKLRMPFKHQHIFHIDPAIVTQMKFVWTNVRHPVKYYESVWKWMTHLKRQIADAQTNSQRKVHTRRFKSLLNCSQRMEEKTRFVWHPHSECAKVYDSDFNVWVERMLETQGNWVTRLYWLTTGPPGGEWCHYIGRTSSITQDLFNVLELLGKELTQKDKDKVNQLSPRNAYDYDIEWRADLNKQMLHEERHTISRWFSGTTFDKRHFGKLERYGIDIILDGIWKSG